MPGSAPSLNPLPNVSDEGVADYTRGRVCSPDMLPMVVVSRYARHFFDPFFGLDFGGWRRHNVWNEALTF